MPLSTFRETGHGWGDSGTATVGGKKGRMLSVDLWSSTRAVSQMSASKKRRRDSSLGEED